MEKLNFDSKWVIRIGSFVAALIFWLFVIASENPDVYTNSEEIPVTFVGVQNLAGQNLTMTSGAKSSVDLRLTGKLDRMYLLNDDTIAVTVDLSSILAPGEYHLPYSVDTGVAGVEATKKTEYITVTVERLVTRTIPVELDIRQQPDEGYVCTEMALDHDAVTVTGPESVVDKIDSIAASFAFGGVRSSGTKTLGFRMVDDAGDTFFSDELRTDVSSIRLSYVIHQRKPVPLTVDVAATQLIGSDRISWSVEPAELTLTGNTSYISGINEIKLGSLNLQDLLQQGIIEDNKIELSLPVAIPNGATCEDVPEEAAVIIELRGLEQHTVTVPAEYFTPIRNMRFITESLDIRILGTAVEVTATQPVTVLVTPLLSPDELGPGVHTVPVRVDPDRNVTVLGDYTVNVFVEEIIPG